MRRGTAAPTLVLLLAGCVKNTPADVNSADAGTLEVAAPPASAVEAPQPAFPAPPLVGSGPHPGPLLAGQARSYRGTVEPDLGVMARLRRSSAPSDAISGTYFYEKVGTSLDLAGTVGADGPTVMKETKAGDATGELRGRFDPYGNFVGTWLPPDGGAPRGLRLTPIEPSASDMPVLVARRRKTTVQKANGPVSGSGQAGDDLCKYDVAYPEVYGIADPKVEAAINAKLAPPFEPPASCDHMVEQEGTFDVALNAHGVLSIRLWYGVTDTHAAHPSQDGRCVNVLVATGEDVRLGDVLKPNSGAALLARLRPDLKKATKGDDALEHDLEAALAPPNTDFLLRENGVSFVAADHLPHVEQGVDPGTGFLVTYDALRSLLPTGSKVARLWAAARPDAAASD